MSSKNVFKTTNYQYQQNDSQRIIDYFCVVGLPNKLTTLNNDESLDEERDIYYPDTDYERHGETKLDPIVDLCVLNKSLNEFVPADYECIWMTKAGHSANLNHSDALFKTNHEMFICFRRGRDKPPITDIGIYYEGSERIMPGCELITKTVGNNSANVNNSSFSADRIFVTYRRSEELACNLLAVIDVCVIIKSKGEQAPHTFNEIPKNLNRGLFGASVFLCYKKAWIPAPQIKYLPTTLYRYPSIDHNDLNFPTEVAMFGLPMGAVIESWPLNCTQTSTNIKAKPAFSTFVLNVSSEDGIIAEKVYGASIMFYESYDERRLNGQQTLLLNHVKDKRSLHSNKCLLLLSRHALFESFREFLLFLYTKYTKGFSAMDDLIPIERYLDHLIYQIPLPTHQKPRSLVNLTDNDEDCLSINLPDESILPQFGASYIELLKNLGVDNSINVFMYLLLQRNVMVHSLHRVVLTGVVEALSSIIFPFLWRYSYLPMCPLNLCQLIEAPGSFILGMDSRFFDLFDPPDNVICVDLDTNTISWPPDHATLNSKILPKKAMNILRNRLAQLYSSIHEYTVLVRGSTNQPHTNDTFVLRQKKRKIELHIREAFLRFMTCIMSDYKQHMRTVTRRPDTKAMDRNLGTFFDCEGFVASKEPTSRIFFKELTKTQLFYDFALNMSFAMEMDACLIDSFAFFAECCSKNIADDEYFLELRESSNKTVVYLPPSLSTPNELDTNLDFESISVTSGLNPKDFIFLKNSSFVYHNEISSECSLTRKFPRVKSEFGLSEQNLLNHQINQSEEYESFQSIPNQVRKESFNSASSSQSQLIITNNRKLKAPNTPVGVRTNAEKLQSQRRIEQAHTINIINNNSNNNNSSNNNNNNSSKQANDRTKFLQAKTRIMCLLSNSYALWFIYLAEHLRLCESNRKKGLNYAYKILIQMKNHQINKPDEICFRTMMQLCLFYKQPTLAVKTFLHMKMNKIELTPITYSYYNMALIDPSNWPCFEQDRWAKVRLILNVITKFKYCLRIKREREQAEEILRNKSNSRSNRKTKINRKKFESPSKNSNRNKSSTIKSPKNRLLIKKPEPISDTIDISMHFHSLDAASGSKPLASPKSSLVTSSTVKRQLFKTNTNTNTHDNESFKICYLKLEEVNLVNGDDLISTKGTILFISDKKRSCNFRPKTNNMPKTKRSLSLSQVNQSHYYDYDEREKIMKDLKNTFKRQVTVQDDPLNAFNQLAMDDELKRNDIGTEEQILKKRLFDYKPFASTEDKHSPSDFIFEKVPVENDQLENVQKEIVYGSHSDCLEENLSYNDTEDEEDYEHDEEGDEGDEDDEDDFDDYEYDEESDYNYSDKASCNDMKSNNSNRSINASIKSINSASDLTACSSSKKQEESGFDTPKPASVNRFSMFMKKMENTVEMGKIKGVTKFITDKSAELKDAIITGAVSPLSQQEITSKLKSFSNYQINAGQYLNGLVKSNSSYTSSNSAPSLQSQQKKLRNQASLNDELELEALPDDEELYKPISTKWWMGSSLEKDGDPKNEKSMPILDEQFLLDIKISSCNFCETCKSFLYDEEIMSGWSFNDSDLNIKCAHCFDLLVPKLYINIKELDALRIYIENNYIENFEQLEKTSHPFDQDNYDESNQTKNIIDQLINVEYLSPLVVRKEIENIILNKSKTDEPLINENFMNEHLVIFWNLIWYFKRVGVDGSYLLDLLLNERIESRKRSLADNGIFIVQQKSNHLSSFQDMITKPFFRHTHVKVNCMWDNLKMKNDINYYEAPLYLTWLNADNWKINITNITKSIETQLITVLSNNELKSCKKNLSNNRSLAKLFELIIRNIKEGEVSVPIKNMIRERTLARINFSSIYREVLFLLLVALERYLIDIDAFDTEYRKAFKRILHNTASKDLTKLADKPPNNSAVWSRRLFSPLSL